MSIAAKSGATGSRRDALLGSNQSGIRAHNERLVLSLVRRHGPLAKSEISRMSGLSAQSVSVIMRSLEAERLLKKEEPRRGKVGQPLVPMRIDPEGAYFFGLMIGRRSVDLVLTDFEGAIVGKTRHAHRRPDPDEVVRFAVEGVARLLRGLPPKHRSRVAGLGVAAPFRIWSWARHLGVSEAELSGWRDRDIAAELGAEWDFPVFFSNDATAACGAELVFGDQNKPREFLYYFVGFFIGGGLVLDNAVYSGPTGNAAALGSMPVSIDAAGVRHLVDVASLATLQRAAAAPGGADHTSWDAPEDVSAPPDILDRWMEDASAGMAQATLAAASLVDFGCVVIDGWMPPALRGELTRRTADRLAEIGIEGIDKPEVREGGIGPDARALGAASLPLSERFLVDRNIFSKG